MRGGGGNFGVVTSFLFQLHPISTVYGGPMFWPLEQATEVLQVLARLHPERARGHQRLVRRSSPCRPRRPSRSSFTCRRCARSCGATPARWSRPRSASSRFARLDAPAIDFAGPIPWPALQSLFDALYPPGLQWYWKADFFNDLSDKAIDLHVKYGAQLPTMHSTMHIYPINGAAHRAGKNDTAFSFRDANFAEVIVGVDPDPANNERMIQWAQGLLDGAASLLGGWRLYQHDDG